MNLDTHRLVFNKTRGCLMAVVETTRSSSKCASGAGKSQRGRRGRSIGAIFTSHRPTAHIECAQTAIEFVAFQHRSRQLLGSDPAEAAKWAEGGVYRSLAHAVIGGLTGGMSGAAGAGLAALSADAINKATDNLPEGVKSAVGAAIATGIGAAVGGAAGAATAFNSDMNNRQLHPTEQKKAQELSAKSGGKYTKEQIEEQMRLMGNLALGIAPNKTEVLTKLDAINNNLTLDPGMPKVNDGRVVVEKPGQANAEIQKVHHCQHPRRFGFHSRSVAVHRE